MSAIIAFSNAYSQQLLELGGSAVNGVCFPVIFFADSDDPEIQAYVKQYTDVYGSCTVCTDLSGIRFRRYAAYRNRGCRYYRVC